MNYRAIGLYSENPAEGLDIVFASFIESAGNWNSELLFAAKYIYTDNWKARLAGAAELDAKAYCSLHTAFGIYIGELVNRFISENALQYKVALIAWPGHITMTSHDGNTIITGDGARIAAATRIPVISDFFALDQAWGGRIQNNTTVLEKLGGADSRAAHHPAWPYALMGVLRWRQEYNVFASDTGAQQNSIGGAFWNGDEA